MMTTSVFMVVERFASEVFESVQGVGRGGMRAGWCFLLGVCTAAK